MPAPSSDNSAKRLPTGCYPAMPTAFDEDRAIDFDGVDRMTDFFVEAGVAGIFACGLSAEINWMDDSETVQLAERIARRAAGRVAIVTAAISSGSLDEQAELIGRVHDTDADVVAFSVAQLAEQSEDDQVWLGRAESLLELIPESVPLALYECPLPYWRLLSDETIGWVARTGRFRFLKDTCCRIETIRARLEIIRDTPLQLFNANTETLLDSLQAGANGFCGIGANYFPRLYGWLCQNFAAEPDVARELQAFFDTTFEPTEGEFYPVSAKEYLRQRGVDIGLFSRKLPGNLPEESTRRLSEMRGEESAWTQRLFT